MLARMDLDKKEDVLSVKKIDVGFATVLQRLTICTECQTTLKSMVEKVVERSH